MSKNQLFSIKVFYLNGCEETHAEGITTPREAMRLSSEILKRDTVTKTVILTTQKKGPINE